MTLSNSVQEKFQLMESRLIFYKATERCIEVRKTIRKYMILNRLILQIWILVLFKKTLSQRKTSKEEEKFSHTSTPTRLKTKESLLTTEEEWLLL